jgi:hypothetical protein
LALGALRSTPAQDLELEAGIPPLHLRRQEQTLKYYARIKSNKTNNPVHGVLEDGYFHKSKFKDPHCLGVDFSG